VGRDVEKELERGRRKIDLGPNLHSSKSGGAQEGGRILLFVRRMSVKKGDKEKTGPQCMGICRLGYCKKARKDRRRREGEE